MLKPTIVFFIHLKNLIIIKFVQPISVSSGSGRTAERFGDGGHHLAGPGAGNRHDPVDPVSAEASDAQQKEIATGRQLVRCRRKPTPSPPSSLSIAWQIDGQFATAGRRGNARLSDQERVAPGAIHQQSGIRLERG
jgi:hypothetical protein